MFQQLNDEKLSADDRKDRMMEIGWIVGGLMAVAIVVWFLVRHTIA
jgi:hypothetical protein